MYSLEKISPQMIRSAQERIKDLAIRTPLIRLNVQIHLLKYFSSWRTFNLLAPSRYVEPVMRCVWPTKPS